MVYYILFMITQEQCNQVFQYQVEDISSRIELLLSSYYMHPGYIETVAAAIKENCSSHPLIGFLKTETGIRAQLDALSSQGIVEATYEHVNQDTVVNWLKIAERIGIQLPTEEQYTYLIAADEQAAILCEQLAQKKPHAEAFYHTQAERHEKRAQNLAVLMEKNQNALSKRYTRIP